VHLNDADREALFGNLNRHVAAGSLTIEELERRVEAIARGGAHHYVPN
jgi:hypothetical protein